MVTAVGEILVGNQGYRNQVLAHFVESLQDGGSGIGKYFDAGVVATLGRVFTCCHGVHADDCG